MLLRNYPILQRWSHGGCGDVPLRWCSEALKRRNFIDPSSVLVRRDLVLSVGGFDPNMRAAEDWELWLKLLRVCKFVDVPERLLRYRVTSSSASSDPEIHLNSMERIVAAGTADLTPARRFVESRRMRSVRYSMIAIKYREKGDYRNRCDSQCGACVNGRRHSMTGLSRSCYWRYAASYSADSMPSND